MAINVRTEFVNTATIRTIVYVYNDNEVLTAPTNVNVSIWNPSGTAVVDEEDVVATGLVEVGKYEHYYHKNASADAMAAGQWRGEVLIIDGAGADAVITPCPFSFKVK